MTMQTETTVPQSVELYAKLTMPKLDGWCQPEKAIALARYTMDLRPDTALEIGVYAGRSLIAVAMAMKELKHGKIIGIDPWDPVSSIEGFDDANKAWWNKLDHEAIKAKCEFNIAKAGVKDYVELIQATNRTALPLIQERNCPIGLLSIDGNHSPEQSCFDVDNYVPMVPVGGVIFFDDADWETTQKAVGRLMDTCKLKEIVGNCAVFLKI